MTLNKAQQIADRVLMTYGSTDRNFIRDQLRTEAPIPRMRTIQMAVNAVVNALEEQQALDQIEAAPDALHAAKWFLENVDSNAPWRGDVYHALIERLRGRPSSDPYAAPTKEGR